MSSSINPPSDPLIRNSLNSVGNRVGSPIRQASETAFETELAALQIGEESLSDLPEFSTLAGSGGTDTNTFIEEARLLARLKASLTNHDSNFTGPDDENLTAGKVQIPSNVQPNGYPQFASQNNNPGNLRFAHQPGAELGAGGFAQFSTPEDGYRALIRQVRLDTNRGLTLSQYISKYAPPAENDTALYIEQAGKALGVDVNTPLADINPDDIAVFQARKESGTTIL